MKKKKDLESLQSKMFTYRIEHSFIQGKGITFRCIFRCWHLPDGGDILEDKKSNLQSV